ncbi:MAG: TIGR03808 family TAT-translocated repetitive protein [Hyphomicrobiaceae bacterium]
MPSLLPRRTLLVTAAGGLMAGLAARASAAPRQKAAARAQPARIALAQEFGLGTDTNGDQSVLLQTAIDQAALNGVALQLPPGRIRVAGVALRRGTHLLGQPGTVLQGFGSRAVLHADMANALRIERIAIEGEGAGSGTEAPISLLEIRASRDIVIADVTVRRAPRNGLHLVGCSGRVQASRIERVGAAALWALDSMGLEIVGNTVSDCADNGILVWRSSAGEDGTLVSQNRIARVAAASGGSGQNGNGINVFRAGRVRVVHNDIADCAYSAVRGNAASNIQIVGNSVARIGEVALYAEFGFEGALIAQNIVDGAAAGISVTNFNEGGRLAVIQGNLVRNLRRREAEPQDKRGEGISVEADAAVSGNTIEGAPTAGIVIGWGRFMRNVSATGNVIRRARVGIAITADAAAGHCLVAQNVIADATDGAIRHVDHGRPTGDDLAFAPPRSDRIVVSGNVVSGDGA